jgi:hypothetical protein
MTFSQSRDADLPLTTEELAALDAGLDPVDLSGWDLDDDFDPYTSPPDGDEACLGMLAAEERAEYLDALAPPVTETLAAGFWDRGDNQGSAAGFGAGGVADRLLPGPVLAGLTAGAWRHGLGRLSDSELIGVGLAARRNSSWQAALELAVVTELAGRREATGAMASSSGAEHVSDEIAAAFTLTGRAADDLLGLAAALARLPQATALLAAGVIDLRRAVVITRELACLDDVPATAVADQVLPRAGQLTTAQLTPALRRAILAVDPDAAISRRKKAEKDARVETWQETAGTGAIAGRDLPPAQAIAADKRIEALARWLAAGGAEGTHDQLRARAYLALLLGLPAQSLLSATTQAATDPSQQPAISTGSQPAAGMPTAGRPGPQPTTGMTAAGRAGAQPTSGRPPAARTSPQRAGRVGPHPTTGPPPAGTAGAQPTTGHPPAAGTSPHPTASPPPAGRRGTQPATGIPPVVGTGPNPLVDLPPEPASGAAPASGAPVGSDGPAGGWPQWPAGVSGWVNLTMPLASYLGQSLSPGEISGLGPLDAPACRELATAIAAAPGSRWSLTVTDQQGRAVAHGCARAGPAPPPDDIGAWLARLRLHGIAAGGCDHRHESGGYRPSPTLRTLVKTRQRSCAFPGCRRPSRQCDDDHTVPYNQGGATCECNLAPLCRRHHRAKQAPGWRVSQAEPGVLTWSLPNGRNCQTEPGTYPV